MGYFNRFGPRVTALIAAIAFLTSCGGGGTTAGAGGSGIGGTGITATVNGNVAQVVAQSVSPDSDRFAPRMLAAILDILAERVNAQSGGGVGGIRIQGGGQETLTDDMGQFTLRDVMPSDNFQLLLTLQDAQQVSLNIGTVPAGSTVHVANILVNKSQGRATPSAVEVDLSDDASSASDDADSTDEDSEDVDATSRDDDVGGEDARSENDDDSEDDDDSGEHTST